MAAEDAPRTRRRPPYVRNDRHNHLDAAGHLQIDWDKLTLDAATQAGGETEQEGDTHGHNH